ncbi:ribosome biogenesis protein [Candidatus Pacearchaeota archaeon]|nr:MAG: ribosome biogenesis protein [Candidatus Pacearchaeota archaeon]
MKFRIRKCSVCGAYTLKKKHCGTGTVCPHPLKFSPQDKYARYRRRVLFDEK